MQKLLYIALILFLITASCNEEPTVVPHPADLNIISPDDYSHYKERESISIKIVTNINTSINKIELFGYYYDYSADTVKFAEFNHLPIDTAFYLDDICIETDTLTLFAKAIFNVNEIVMSNFVRIIINKAIPPDDSLDIYDYQGFDSDSNLIAQGSFSIFLSNEDRIYGRKNIVAVMSDSAFEKGAGFIRGTKHPSIYGEYLIQMNVCYLLNANGRLFIYIVGEMDGNKFYGARYLGAYDPVWYRIGSFIAIKRE